MTVSVTVQGLVAPFEASRRSRAARCALLMVAAAASWVLPASPALAQGAPAVRIITGNGDFLVNLRQPVFNVIVPGAEEQAAAADEEPSLASPPAALETASILLSAPSLAPEPVISPAPVTETAVSADPQAHDAPAETATPAIAQAAAAATPPASTASSAEAAADAARAAVQSWADAWARKDLNAYFASYGQGFAPAGKQARQRWEESRRARIAGKPHISVTLSDLAIAVQDGLATAGFTQHYRAGALNISSRKTLELTKEAGNHWVIVREAIGQ
jgi:ketosteroid isomerase-like protein